MEDIKVGDRVVCIVDNNESLAPCEICEVQEIYNGRLLRLKGYPLEVFKKDIFRKY